jgi:hypothetical protein
MANLIAPIALQLPQQALEEILHAAGEGVALGYSDGIVQIHDSHRPPVRGTAVLSRHVPHQYERQRRQLEP